MALRTLVTRKSLKGGLGLGFSRLRGVHTVSLPDLPYDYGALEPVISGEIMELHNKKHHHTYVTNYNNALQQLDAAMAKGDTPTVVKLQSPIKFNGGGSSLSYPTRICFGCWSYMLSHMKKIWLCKLPIQLLMQFGCHIEVELLQFFFHTGFKP